jgi:hypothetical protein
MKNTLNRHRYYNPKQTLKFKNPEFYLCYMPHIKKKKKKFLQRICFQLDI